MLCVNSVSSFSTLIRVAICCALLLAHGPICAADGECRYVGEYPTATSKKGLQVEDTADALALGIKHAAINVNLSRLIDVNERENCEASWKFDGRQYCFNAAYLAELDSSIETLSSHGVIVNLILLAYATDDQRTNKIMLHPRYDQSAPNRLGMFNTATPDGRATLAAIMEFVAERWSRPDKKFGRVAGYIVGNEVNSHWWWCNMGRVSMEEFADAYLDAVRLIHSSVRKQASWARVYVSLDHHWGISYAAGDEQQAFPGRDFVDYFARQARENGDFDWNIAYHPYPENLFEPRFWNDTTALPKEDTSRITFKNLEVLVEYLKRPELLFVGLPRRIILSEQGFHTPAGPDGETLQAAAYCAAYKRVENLEGVDAFILHRHIDNLHEGGLMLGLRGVAPCGGEPRRKKRIYGCFRAADTPEWESAFKFALPIIGKQSW